MKNAGERTVNNSMRECAAVSIAVCICIILCGCGGESPAKLAKEKLTALKEEYAQKEKEEFEVYEPQPVNVGMREAWSTGKAQADDWRENEELSAPREVPTYNERGEYMGNTRGYIQFIASKTDYVFQEAEYLEEPYTVIMTSTKMYMYYEPVSAEKVQRYETEEGKYYDPTQDAVENAQRIKVEEITFSYNLDTKEWEETDRTVLFDAEGE
jgi:hypothetical protein